MHRQRRAASSALTRMLVSMTSHTGLCGWVGGVHAGAGGMSANLSRAWSNTRHLTAFSMNLERSPFFMPRCARTVRTAMSVSRETETVQRVVVSLTFIADTFSE